MKCPNCGDPMAATRLTEVEIDQCPKCRGLWFDALEAEKAADAAQAAAKIDDKGPAEPPNLYGRRCPRCRVPLKPSHVTDQPHIKIDTCPSCFGSFYDAGEFRDAVEKDFADRVKDSMAAIREQIRRLTSGIQ